jgi:hypothetical protein
LCHKPKQLKYSEIKNIRENLADKNDNCCPICGRKFSEKIKQTLDHDHDTFLIRDTICNSCNQIEGHIKGKLIRYGLWKQVDYATYLRKLADHIDKEQLPLVHPSHAPKQRKLQKRSYNELSREIDKANEYLKKKMKIPPYPKSKRLTKKLKELFDYMGIKPKFYSKA